MSINLNAIYSKINFLIIAFALITGIPIVNAATLIDTSDQIGDVSRTYIDIVKVSIDKNLDLYTIQITLNGNVNTSNGQYEILLNNGSTDKYKIGIYYNFNGIGIWERTTLGYYTKIRDVQPSANGNTLNIVANFSGIDIAGYTFRQAGAYWYSSDGTTLLEQDTVYLTSSQTSSVWIESRQSYMEQQFVSNGSFQSGLSDLIYRMTLEIKPVSGNFQVSKIVIYNTTAIDINRTYYQIDEIDKGKGTISVFSNRIEWQGLAETPASQFELGIYASNPYKINIPFSSTRSINKEIFIGQGIATISISATPSQNLKYLEISSFASETDDVYSQLFTSTATNPSYIDRSSSDEIRWSFDNAQSGNVYTTSVQLNVAPKINGIVRYWQYSKVEAGYGSFSYTSSGYGENMVSYTDTVIGDVEIYFVNPVDYQVSANGKGVYYQRFREYSEMVTNGEPTSIKIDDNFKPGIRTVPAGTTVTWKNNDPISHNIVSNTGLFSSPSLGQYQQFSYTFNTPGTYDYSCSNHPSMTGKVIVTSSASTPAPTPSPTSNPTPTATPTVTPTPAVNTGVGGTVVSIANATATADSNVTRAIMVENVNNLAAATVWLTYDPSVVNVLSVSAGDLGGVTTNIDNTIGKVTMSAFSTTAKSGNVVFANVLLKSVGQINATSPLTLSVPSLADQNGVTIPGTIRSGTFTISSVIKGDVNGDNQVTIVDALFVAQYTVGMKTLSASQLAAADVNGDGQVTIVDALFIAQYTVGLRQL